MGLESPLRKFLTVKLLPLMQPTDRLIEMHRIYNTDMQQIKDMSEERFNRIVQAIATGQYSWACLLVLRFAGYNPLHYIPYRTYNRLMKDHRENERLPATSKIPNLERK